ncbi:hypothetical protein IAQ61_002204, partial [Plenodomus lingam]|uniref:uncharacterized protein n=1 Tax=Leptosphaeria maculans TaxID=5022 RepID=UPI003319BDE3
DTTRALHPRDPGKGKAICSCSTPCPARYQRPFLAYELWTRHHIVITFEILTPSLEKKEEKRDGKARYNKCTSLAAIVAEKEQMVSRQWKSRTKRDFSFAITDLIYQCHFSNG